MTCGSRRRLRWCAPPSRAGASWRSCAGAGPDRAASRSTTSARTGRRFPGHRCLIPANGFYEFTDPEPPAPKRARKTKWLFTLAGEPWFCIAGLVRPGAADGADAFVMLTTEPGPDVAAIHPRQVVVLGPSDWMQWLDGPEPEALLRSSPAGALAVERLG